MTFLLYSCLAKILIFYVVVDIDVDTGADADFDVDLNADDGLGVEVYNDIDVGFEL